MRCPKCQSLNDGVIDSKVADSGNAVRRRRKCRDCSFRFTTYERPSKQGNPIIIGRSGKRQTYSPDRVSQTVHDAFAKLPIDAVTVDRVVLSINHLVMNDGRRMIPVNDLGLWIAESLGRIDEVARVRFEMEWKRPEDAAGCVEILLDYMRRQASK